MGIRILFDTSTVRGIVHGVPECQPLERFDAHAAGLSICLANNVVPELVVALFQGRVRWDQWTSRASFVDRLLDPDFPVFPSDDETRSLFFAPPKRTTISRAEHNEAIWRLLVRAKSATDLESGPPFLGSDGVEYQIKSSRELAERLSEDHRESWRQMIRDAKAQIVGHHPTQEHVADLQFKAFFGGRPDEEDLRRRNDGYVRSFSRFLAMALGAGESYNADSDSRRGDSFDLESLQALASPALVCTLDKRLRRHVELAGSAQAKQLLSPAELVNEASQNSLSKRVV